MLKCRGDLNFNRHSKIGRFDDLKVIGLTEMYDLEDLKGSKLLLTDSPSASRRRGLGTHWQPCHESPH